MARLKTLGFELQSTNSGVENSFTEGSISSNQAHSGTVSLRVNISAASSDNSYTFDPSESTELVYARVWFYVAALPTDVENFGNFDGPIVDICNLVGLVGGLVVGLDTDGKVYLFDGNLDLIGNTATGISTGAWHCLQFMHDHANTTIELRLDGELVAMSASALTDPGLSELAFGVGLAYSFEATADIYFDDIAINDGTGGFENEYPSIDGKVLYLLPSAAGDVNTFATQTGGTAGAANNFTRVDEITPNDATDFNGSSTLNEEDLFNITDSGISQVDTVSVVEVHARFRNSTADTTGAFKVELMKVPSGTIQQSGSIVPNSTTWRTNAPGTGSPRTAPIVAYKDPDGQDWTKSNLDTAQIGYKLTTAPANAGRRCDITKVWMIVEYIEGDYHPRHGVVGFQGVGLL